MSNSHMQFPQKQAMQAAVCIVAATQPAASRHTLCDCALATLDPYVLYCTGPEKQSSSAQCTVHLPCILNLRILKSIGSSASQRQVFTADATTQTPDP